PPNLTCKKQKSTALLNRYIIVYFCLFARTQISLILLFADKPKVFLPNISFIIFYPAKRQIVAVTALAYGRL
ncbi:MAG: hypothetical protein KJ930_08725, partial [Gammaproteobacteria bacterium]|nr:hypothetical protein [Gammaproteobacteria bacterium]